MSNSAGPWVGWKTLNVGERPAVGDDLRRYHRHIALSTEQQIVVRLLEVKAPALYRGEADQTLTKEELDALLAEIVRDCEGYAVKHRHNFLVKGLTKGQQELNWAIPIPGRINVIHRDRSPFTPDGFEILHALRRIDARFEAVLGDASFYQNQNDYIPRVDIRSTHEKYDLRQLHAGQILYCAVMRGALLDAGWLGRLGDAVQAGLFIDEGELWLELTRRRYEDNPDDLECRRWFPDPLTAGLLIRYCRHHGNDWPEVASGKTQVGLLLRWFMKAMGLNASQIPTLRQFIEASTTHHRLSLHGYLVDYAQGLNRSVSLPAHAWLRFRWSHAKRPTVNVIPELAELTNRIYGRRHGSRKFINSNIYPDQRKEFRALQEIVKKIKNSKNQKVAGVTKALTKYIEEPGKRIPILILLAEWLRDMMQSTRVTGMKIKPSSARTYLSAVGKGLVDYGADLDVLGLNTHDFQAYYKQVLGTAVNADALAYKRERIAAFHRYLVLEYQMPDDVVEEVEARVGRVDANLITPAEYLEARAMLENAAGANPRWRTIRRLVLMLGYKCGLRREEIETLYVSDLQDRHAGEKRSPRPELIVKNNAHATVKVISSVRRIPLHTFLNPEEIEDLFAWKSRRLQECTNRQLNASLLFCEQGKNTDRITDREVFRYVTVALQVACGDPDIRFHHLRHSFGNFTLLRMMTEEHPDLPVARWFGGSFHTLWPKLGERGLRGLLLIQKGSEPSRRMLYALSALCGHVDPRETLQSYLHVLDWCLGRLLWMAPDEMRLDTQAAIEGISLESLRVRRSRNKQTGMLTRARWASDTIKKYATRVERPNQNGWLHREPRALISLTVDDPVDMPSAVLLYEIFLDIYHGGSSSAITARYGYSLHQIHEWKQRAHALARLKTARDTDRLVRRNKKTAPSMHLIYRRPTLPTLTVAPPRIHSERAEAERLYRSMIDLHDSIPELIEKGMQLCLYRTSRAETWLNLVDDTEKRLFIQFVKAIGIPERRIRLEVEHLPVHAPGRLAAKWAKRLGLPKRNIFLIERTRRAEPTEDLRAEPTGDLQSTRDPMGLAHLWVVSPENRAVGGRLVGNHTTWPIHALRFAVYMAAIYLGIKPKEIKA